MRATVLSRPEGRDFTRSPGLTVPAAIWPEKPRKSRFGRLTHCTGMRNDWPRRSSSTWTPSSQSIRIGPSNQGESSPREAMLAPVRPEIGIGVKASRPIWSAKAR
jgi:hypothetical protein